MAISKQVEPIKYLRVREVAEMLGLREMHVYKMIYRREIESCIIGRRSRRIPLHAVLDMIRRGTTPALS